MMLIESMINKARNQFHENGHLYLLWGWVVLFCSISQFVLIRYVGYERHYLVWLLTWVAVVYQMIYLFRKKKRRKVRTYTDGILANVWLAFVVSMLLIGFIEGKSQGGTMGGTVTAYFIALYGIPTFLSGTILRFMPLKAGGICCWVLAVVSAFIPGEYKLLVLGAAVIAAWIIPGYLLRRRYYLQQLL